MNTNRTEKIKSSLQELGPKLGELYTNQQMIDKSIELQTAIADQVAEITNSDTIKGRDLRKALQTIAKEHGLESVESFLRLDRNINELGYTIASFIKGQRGERIARNALRLLQYDDGVRILYNIALEDEESQAEYDAIVITPYGLFVVEVKNWAGDLEIDEWGILHRDTNTDIQYDVPGRMNIKECLLRECLGDKFPKYYESILLFSNNGARIRDNFKQYKMCLGGAIVQVIRSSNTGEVILNEDDIKSVEAALIAKHKEQYTESKINCDEIINDFSDFISMIENRKTDTVEDLPEVHSVTTHEEKTNYRKGPRGFRTIKKHLKDIDWKQFGGIAAEALIIGSIALRSGTPINVIR